jgi:hypothetical protein
MFRTSTSRFVYLAIAMFTAVTARHTRAAPGELPAGIEPVLFASGDHANRGDQPAVVFFDVLAVAPNVTSMRVLFSETMLPGGSYLRVTSLLDGASQTLDAREVAKWGNGTAFFNGWSVLIELVAAPRSEGNAFRVREVLVAPGGGAATAMVEAPGTVATVCGVNDTRTPNTNGDQRVGRLLETYTLLSKPSYEYCTAFIIDSPPGPQNVDKLHLTAGHCFGDRPSGLLPSDPFYLLEFNVDLSNSDCTLTHPSPKYQFPVVPSSVRSCPRGKGNDWAVFRCEASGPVDDRKTTYQRQGMNAAPLAEAIPSAGTRVRVTGFGTDTNEAGEGPQNGAGCLSCDPVNSLSCVKWCEPAWITTGRRNGIQQTDTGDLFPSGFGPFDPGVLAHQADTCGGNSGSPILKNITGNDGSVGEVIGIHTEGGCGHDAADHVTGLNYGTPITNPQLLEVIRDPDTSGVCVPTLSQWGMIAMAALMCSAGGVVIKRRAIGTRH